ncbi:MAG: BRO family protein, partial [Cetobacterium sp.]
DILGKILSIYGDSENPLFLAKDIADWIEHTNVTEMVRNLEDGTEKLNSTILSAGQNREMTLLTEDGVYEVLMTSRKKIAKEIRKGLKEFLKAWRKGEVKVVEKTMSVEEMIISQAKSVIELKNKFEVLEDKVNNQMTIDYGNQRRLQNAISKRVYERADTVPKFVTESGDFSKKNVKVVKLLFSAIYRDIKNKFGVTSYKDVRISDFEECLNLVKVWREDQSVRDKINEL